MNNVQWHMIYLAACGVNGSIPQKECLNNLDMQRLYQTSCAHQMEAIIGMSLQRAGVSLPKEWNECVSKAIRKVVLFDAERAKLFAFMEQRGIWYLPLKGVILKDFYPSIGMRQMSDNDILFDEGFAQEVQKYMEAQGYQTSYFGGGNHDVYKKAPVYVFEMHRALYDRVHRTGWAEYYAEIKDKLNLNNGSAHGYHFKDEDFYVYIVSHGYKHYEGSGTGLRTLLDFYVYLKAKEATMDFVYIKKECEVLGIAEYERLNRGLCRKVFGMVGPESLVQLTGQLKEEEVELLEFYLSAGVYGTMEHMVGNRIRKYREEGGGKSKLSYVISRIFPKKERLCGDFPYARKRKWLMPVAWVHRLCRALFSSKRRKRWKKELNIVRDYE